MVCMQDAPIIFIAHKLYTNKNKTMLHVNKHTEILYTKKAIITF